VLYSITKTTIKFRQITLINISTLRTDDKIELFFFIIIKNLSQQTARNKVSQTAQLHIILFGTLCHNN